LRVLITGGAGFIGANLTAALIRGGANVWVIDSLQREGSAANLERLLSDPALSPSIRFVHGDIRDFPMLERTVSEAKPDAVAHLAAQVAVTSSITDPRLDFDVNAGGTFNVLEAVRGHAPAARLVYTSTNKVYGRLAELRAQVTPTRYFLPDHPSGVDERFPTNATTPYGCSKLAGDLYTRDYAHSYGLATTVFRMSCIYGRWQNGTVDQGWVSWMSSLAVAGKPITIYGDGRQVRDLLHIDDLVSALLAVLVHSRAAPGSVFNIGGGPKNSMSVWAEFGSLLERLTGRQPRVNYGPPRIGDQLAYISDISAAERVLSWTPRISPEEGVKELVGELRSTSPESGRGD
jgi:CDP-paratose 2-epimerase